MCLSLLNNLSIRQRQLTCLKDPSNQVYNVQSNWKWNPNQTIIPNRVTKSMILMKDTIRTYVTNWHNHVSVWFSTERAGFQLTSLLVVTCYSFGSKFLGFLLVLYPQAWTIVGLRNHWMGFIRENIVI